MGSRPQQNKGFSLLELLIAIAIMSIGITVLLQAFAFSGRATGISCDVIKAVMLAKDKLQELEFKERSGLLAEGDEAGEEGKFTWAYKISTDPQIKLYQLNFDISWQRQERKEKISLASYLRK